MHEFIAQVMALGLTLSQLLSKPVTQYQEKFNPATDSPVVAKELEAGCVAGVKFFTAENLNIELLLTTWVERQKAKQKPEVGQEPSKPTVLDRMIKGADLSDLLTAYQAYCKGDKEAAKKLDLRPVIEFYNKAMQDLPEAKTLVSMRLPEASMVQDVYGQRFSEIIGKGNRRTFVPIGEIPDIVKKAFVAAEDQNFSKHKGFDMLGVLRAIMMNQAKSGRAAGGSTITQQVIKNLLLNDDITPERKMRELLLAARLESLVGKDRILELYLNYVYLGRSSWGVDMAAKSYFGKSIREIQDPAQAALLAALVKGPTWYSPDRHPERAQERRDYVLDRLVDEKVITEEQKKTASAAKMEFVRFESPRRQAAFYYLDALIKEAKNKAKIDPVASTSIIRSTIVPELQRATEEALRDGLVAYEQSAKRARFRGAVGSIAKDLEKYSTTWQETLPKVQGDLYDVRWPLAAVVSLNPARVGLEDGQVVPLRATRSAIQSLKVYDLVFVDVPEGKRREPSATLRSVPEVQGAAVVLENKTGRILALSGGFSYAASQFNRALEAYRQPGSTLKPFIFLGALAAGFQPNTLIPDIPISLPPTEKGGKWWSPQNYDRGSRGLVTLRWAIEQSLNLPTVRMMSELGQTTPIEGLEYVQKFARELGIYQQTKPYFPWVLGAQPTRVIDMATAYATVANDGLKPVPYLVESIQADGKTWQNSPQLVRMGQADRVAFYQLRRILEGPVIRGTAERIRELRGLVGGKTGTSNDENDAWFVGFTNDITVAVWVGYDDHKSHSGLGARMTGGRVALPIAEKILRSSFENFKKPEPLAPPPNEILGQIAEYPIDLRTGQFGAGDFQEVFRRDARYGGGPTNTVQALLKPGEINLGFAPTYNEEDRPTYAEPREQGVPFWDSLFGFQQPPQGGGWYQPGPDEQYEIQRRRQRRVSPYYNERGRDWRTRVFEGGNR
ncbi:MAG: penicillin-binding protein 1A [Bdellovibrionales bacterium]